MSTAKRDFLIGIEKKYQGIWDQEKLYEGVVNDLEEPKYFATIPYPYMNGRLHLGHCFTITKVDYATRYQRLKGKNTLFPFAYHCTGMPIKACADKLKYEMSTFGCPPVFPEIEATEVVEEEIDFEKDPAAYEKKKGKMQMKFGDTKYQWSIMEGMGIPETEIPKFADTSYWLTYFPPHCMDDLKGMGLGADWRRGFITTDVNPYYDSFVRWHFNTLKAKNKIKFGKRYSVFSPKDKQPCMDHDRKSGEGVGPQEYTGIKIKLHSPLPSALKSLEGRDVFLVAATLRPETMYGQTNCFVKDDIDYVAFDALNNQVFITTMRAARNMAYQELTPDYGKVNVLVKLTGLDLMGAAIKAPRAKFEKLYVLPMMGVKPNKGTGIVTSVPGDAPDDYAALMDLKNKQPLREKYGITDEMVKFDPVPIISVPGFGDLCAVMACEQMKVNSQNDKDKLLLAKEKCYRKGFDEGVLLVGNHKGEMVKIAKPLIKEEMVASGEAFKYQEPEKEIISRSGDECVIALCDQWFLTYGEEGWKAKTEKCLKNVECYFEDTRQAFERTMAWLHEHACSRSFGLGTKLPWDEQWLVESLSDSTIYMAYYTVAHYLQGDIYGSTPGALQIKPEQMTHEVWNYIYFKSAAYPSNSTLPKDILETLRREFQYWYPVDLRSSGKDLVQNHLTYWLYNHTAVWSDEPDMWPRSVRANGHLLMDGEKMSKSLGNIISLAEGVQIYSADGMRLALADAGDVLEDANFNTKQANAGILRLHTFAEWVTEIVAQLPTMRTGPTSSHLYDRIFANDINRALSQTDVHFGNTMFREGLKTGFYEFLSARDRYKELAAAGLGMHRGLVERYIRAQIIILTPICPHMCDYLWREVLGEGSSVVGAAWPEAGPVDDSLTKASEHLMECVHDFRIKLINYTKPNTKKGKAITPNEPPNSITVIYANDYPAWQEKTLNYLKSTFNAADNSFPDNKALLQHLKTIPEVKPFMKKLMPFVAYVKEQVAVKGVSVLESHLSFSERDVFLQNKEYILRSLDLDDIQLVESATHPDQKLVADVCPGKPMCKFEKRSLNPTTPSKITRVVNIQPCTPHFSLDVPVFDADTVEDVVARMKRMDRKLKTKQVTLYRYVDASKGPRQMLAFDQPMMWNKRQLDLDSTVEYEEAGLKVGGKQLGDTICYTVS